MRYFASFTIFLLACSLMLAQGPTAQPGNELPKLQHLSADQVNPKIDPCTDFYQYTCSKFFAANPIPADRAVWGVVGPLAEWNEVTLRQVLEAAAAKKQDRTAVEQKIGDFWTSCMDESRVEGSSQKALQDELQRINGLKDKSQLAGAIAHLHKTIPGAWDGQDAATFASLFGFGSIPDFDNATRIIPAFDQGGFALPGREFYSATDEKSVDIRKKYVVHITNMLKLAGETEAQASADAAIVLDIETSLAKSAMDIVKRRDPANLNNKMTLEKFAQLAPSFDWKAYLVEVGAPDGGADWLVSSPDFFRGMEQTIQQHPIEHWKAYLRWYLVHGSAPYLGHAFVDENFSLTRTLFGTPKLPPRWRRCTQRTDQFLGEALGQAYVARAFPPSSKERVLKMVKGLEAALEQDTDSLDWMTPDTKKQSKAKLHMILDKIGYPDHWRDYSALNITPDSYLENIHRGTAFEFSRQLKKIGKPLDRQEWTMTPPTINAYYDAQTNTINFPAGILQPPLFDPEQGDAANYGAEGAIIGHEITHGFDDQGRKFDGNGNLRDWWTSADAKSYEERGKCISDQYTQDVPQAGPGVKQNGLLTQGEDTADNGGLHIALIALENALKSQGKTLDSKGSDGLTERQRFFLAYANAWCEELRPEIMRTAVLTDPHSLPNFRVNNVVA
ncbi:MAG TPA: M13 family metallopeptidase, partial [Alphaproteobacteria bacterium]|nr:M13 family metallopeptidase [Alphaproteobacteria bacterium]